LLLDAVSELGDLGVFVSDKDFLNLLVDNFIGFCSILLFTEGMDSICSRFSTLQSMMF